MLKKLKVFLFFQLAISSIACHSETTGSYAFNNPLYLGVLGGYGSTTWEGLVPNGENRNLAMNMSTPLGVREGGDVWGGFVGYEVTPYFALEASYMRYAEARIFFDPMSLFSFNNNGQVEFTTQTDTLSFMGKVMLVIPHSKMRVYSSGGLAKLRRKDILVNHRRQLSPTFGAGVNYHFTDHFMADFGGNYTAGYGESQLNPPQSYYPFLYSFALRLAYCF